MVDSELSCAARAWLSRSLRQNVADGQSFGKTSTAIRDRAPPLPRKRQRTARRELKTAGSVTRLDRVDASRRSVVRLCHLGANTLTDFISFLERRTAGLELQIGDDQNARVTVQRLGA